MSNIGFITTKKHVKSYDILFLLNKINQKRFDSKLTVKQDINNKFAWTIRHPDNSDYLWINCNSAKKLSCKHPNHPWMSYVFVVFQEELAVLTDGILSDEGVDEHWQPNPNKYLSYRKWVELLYSNVTGKIPIIYNSLIEAELQMVPKGMEKY